MPDDDLPLLRSGAGRLGLALSTAQFDALRRYAELLLEANQRVNLTGAKDLAELEVRHLLDSLSVAPYLPPPWREEEEAPIPPTDPLGALPQPPQRPGPVIDVGSGGGMPGLPLAIARPDLSFALLDSVGKKTAFLERAVAALGLGNVEVVTGRAELAGQSWEHRQRYGVAVARAVADLPVLLELTLPFVRLLGTTILMKKGDIDQEIARSRRALRSFGGELLEVATAPLPDLLPDHRLVIVEKLHSTNPNYPRRPGIPERRPLV